MSTDIPIKKITKNECVGDSAAKHNFNLLKLDTEICNLSSMLTINSDNYQAIFDDLKENIPFFIQATNQFEDPLRFNMAYATVNILSSYWSKHTFSVHYPLNISTYANIAISCPTINQRNDKLISVAKSYLNSNFNPLDFNENTNVNLTFFLYNIPVDPLDNSYLFDIQTSPEFSFNIREMYAKFLKKDIHLLKGNIYKFEVQRGNWVFLGVVYGDQDTTQQDDVEKETPIRIVVNTTKKRPFIEITITDSQFNFDLYYHVIGTGKYLAGNTDIKVIINSSVVIGSEVLNREAFSINGFKHGDDINILNYGTIVGYGGNGGYGQSLGIPLNSTNNGTAGGNAIVLNYPVKMFLNDGTIAGGGGGGGGGLASYKDNSFYSIKFPLNSNGTKPILKGGGGGGGGAGNTKGYYGVGGSNVSTLSSYSFTTQSGTNGNDGSLTIPGNGGFGYTNGTPGGTLGQKGQNSGGFDSRGISLPPFGGAPGYCVIGLSLIQTLSSNRIGATFGDLLGPYKS
mgnify:CR=1 FL=1|jgi:hypothetical protein